MAVSPGWTPEIRATPDTGLGGLGVADGNFRAPVKHWVWGGLGDRALDCALSC